MSSNSNYLTALIAEYQDLFPLAEPRKTLSNGELDVEYYRKKYNIKPRSRSESVTTGGRA